MLWFWNYLTTPGRSMTHYVLRVAPVLAAGWGVLFAVVMLPPIFTGADRLGWSFDLARMPQSPQTIVALAFVVLGVFLALATFMVVNLLQRVMRNRFLIVVAVTALAALAGSVMGQSMGAAPAGIMIVSAMFGWAGFILAVAAQVGRMSSTLYSVAAPNLVMASAVLATGLLAQFLSVEPTACEERRSPEREKCIIQEEHLNALRLAWEKPSFMDEPGNGSAVVEETLRQSAHPAMERMLKAALADCEKLPHPKNDQCRHELWKMQNEAPSVLLERVDKTIAERNARRQRINAAAMDIVRKELLKGGVDRATLDMVMEVRDLIPEERRENPTTEDVIKAVEELKARRLVSQQKTGL